MAALCGAVVIGFYGWRTSSAVSELGDVRAADAYYNLLVDGFRRGQLSLNLAAPEGLQHLADPYDPVANAAFRKPMFVEGRLCDMTYFEGKLYLYFSPVPALLLFWPFHAVTGVYLRHHAAVAIFCSIGFLVASGLIFAVWRRYFPTVHGAAVAAGVLVLGLANGVPVMMARPDLWEVPISCAYALIMLALAAIWCGLHDPERRFRWAAAASVACALAIASRPSALFGAVILLVPLVDAWRGGSAGKNGRLARVWAVGAALAVPLLLVGLGLVIYNYQRFGQPLEFGQRYQLADDRQDSVQHFSPSYLWFNLRLYFLSFAGWDPEFPFLRDVVVPPLPPGHGVVDRPYGMLTNTPVILLACAVPLFWRRVVPRLRVFVVAVALVFATSALVLGLFYGTCTRYLVDFGPALSVLACLGLFVALDWVGARRRLRFGLAALVVGLLMPSAAFGVLKSFQGQFELRLLRARALVATGRWEEGAVLYEQIVASRPSWHGAQFELALAYERLQRLPEAIDRCERALRLAPDEGPFHAALARLYLRTGRSAEAVERFEIAVRKAPLLAEAYNGLGVARFMGQAPAEAERALAEAVRLAPENPSFHFNHALALMALGRSAEAIAQLQESLRLNPDYPGGREKLEEARQQAKARTQNE